MQVAVWDTYVTKEDGTIMHFDIIVPNTVDDKAKIFTFGKEYLASKNQVSQSLSSKECRFCHIQQAPETMVEEIKRNGYFIYEMENCN